MKEGWNVIVRYDEFFKGVNVWFVHRQGNKETVVLPINLEQRTEIEPAVTLPEPTLQFHGNDARQFLQGLAEGLVDAGFKPDEIKVADEKVKAINYHLEDMRRLVFEDKLDIVKIG